MRRSHGNFSLYSASANGAVMTAAANETAAPAQPYQPDPALLIDPHSLPVLQQAALLAMRENHYRRAVVTELLTDSQDAPSWPDYQALVDRGLAVRNAGKRFHELTDSGRVIALRLEQNLCMAFGIHALAARPSSTGWQTTFTCPCGFKTDVRRSPTAPGNAAVRHAGFVRTRSQMNALVKAMKPPARAEG